MAAKDEESDTAPRVGRWLRSVVAVGLGLILGALAGIVVGLVTGVGIALALGVL